MMVDLTPEELEVVVQWTEREARYRHRLSCCAKAGSVRAYHATAAQALRARAAELAAMRERATP